MTGPRAALLALLAVLALGACGRKGPPVAPEVRVPLPPADLGATVRSGEIALNWRNPARRADNTRLRDLVEVTLWRVADEGVGEPKPAILSGDRVVGYTRLIVIRVGSPAPAVIERNQVQYVDRSDLNDGWRYTYVVTATDSQERTSAPSPRLSVTFITAPKPPTNLTGTAGERQATLAWGPPAELADGRPLSGTITYEVLRAASPDAAPAPVTKAPIADREYADTKLENEQTYYYSVRAVRAEAAGTAVSEPSAPLALTPRDMTPPSPPTGLVTIATAGSVRLFWEVSPEPDVADYVIYRGAPGAELQRVGSVRAPTTVFVDTGVPAGTYRYAVSAFDAASTPNESPRSAEVSVTVP
jgi:fibronectin type 3 domain-containing protein/predicted small lipoprotein YifL